MARTPEHAFHFARISVIACCIVTSRSDAGAMVTNTLAVLTSPPWKPPIDTYRIGNSGRSSIIASQIRTRSSVKSIEEPTGVLIVASTRPMSCDGVISERSFGAIQNDAANTATPAPRTSQRCRSVGTSARLYAAAMPSNDASTAWPNHDVRLPTARNCAERDGVSVSASSSESSTATVIVTPNWKKKAPMIPFMNATGRKMATIAAVAAIAANAIRARRRPIRGCAIPPPPRGGRCSEHHDRVVDHDADRERQPEQRERVQREAEEVHHGERRRATSDREQHVDRGLIDRGTPSRRAP